MTNRSLAEIDALCAEAFRDAGMADAATYVRQTGDTPIPCTVLVDRGLQDVGDVARKKNPLVAVTAFLAEIQMPIVNVSEFTVESETVVVADIADNSDESRVVCTVRPK